MIKGAKGRTVSNPMVFNTRFPVKRCVLPFSPMTVIITQIAMYYIIRLVKKIAKRYAHYCDDIAIKLIRSDFSFSHLLDRAGTGRVGTIKLTRIYMSERIN